MPMGQSWAPRATSSQVLAQRMKSSTPGISSSVLTHFPSLFASVTNFPKDAQHLCFSNSKVKDVPQIHQPLSCLWATLHSIQNGQLLSTHRTPLKIAFFVNPSITLQTVIIPPSSELSQHQAQGFALSYSTLHGKLFICWSSLPICESLEVGTAFCMSVLQAPCRTF